MQNWICRTPETQAELTRLVHARTHIGHPIPAYRAAPDSSADTLLLPHEYERAMRGALVSLKVAVAFQHLGGKANVDSYYADIRELRVLRARPESPKSPSRRKMADAMARARGARKA